VGLGTGGDDVGLVAALGEDAVDALLGADVLPQRSDVDVAQHRRIEGVAALVRERSRVGGLARVRGGHLLHGDHVHASHVEAGGVDHERGVDPVERAALRHLDLAAAPLLGRRAEHHDAPSRLCRDRRSREARAQPGGGDDVVPAAVPDAGQRVVLAQHRDRRPAGAGPCGERGLEPVGVAFDVEALVLQHLGQQVVGEPLLVVELRVGVDLV
jgi:hypothetical protein